MGVRRILGAFWLAAAMGLAAAVPAGATTRVSVKTEYYRISGKTGAALLDQMDRRGPKHGFMSRAIAQTRYSMYSGADWSHSNGICRARDVSVDLSITYVYPRPAGPVSTDLLRRWKTFMAGVVAHEEMHGRIARQMASAAAKAVSGMAVRDARDCPSVDRMMKRKIDAIVAAYEARQERFDDQEHRQGGNIDGLVRSLAIR
jgi:predicted secreted Zn-dependent protease